MSGDKATRASAELWSLPDTRPGPRSILLQSPDTVRQYEWTSSPGLGPLGQPTSTTMMTDRYSPRTRVAIGNQAKRLSTILTTQATHGASMEPIPTPASSRGQPDENCPPRDHVYRSLQDTSRPSRYIDQLCPVLVPAA